MDESIRYTKQKYGCRVEALADGKPVSRLRIEDYQMRLGEAWVRMGGIAAVETNPAERGKGYGRRLLEGAVAYMRREGYPVSVLFGVPNFYHRFGYATVLVSKGVVRVRTEAAESLVGADVTVREAGPGDAEALLAIYHAENAARNGKIRRKKSSFFPHLAPDAEWFLEAHRILLAEVNGQPVAYALANTEWREENSEWRVFLHELEAPAAVAHTAGVSLIRALGAHAAAQRQEWVCFEMLPDAPVLDTLRSVGYRQEVTYRRNQGGMGRIIDLAALADALTKTLAKRSQALAGETRVGRIVFRCGDEEAAVALGRGRALAIALPQHALLQLLLGYRGIGELRLEYPACIAERDAAAVNALFPRGYPYTWLIDHF